MATVVSLSACGTTGIVIPDSLRAPCEPTFDASTAQTIGDLSKGIVQGDADTRVCSVKKDAVIAIAEANNRPWWRVF
jgi:hypothetical protein